MQEKISKEYLIKVFKEAKANDKDVCVEVTIPGQSETEYIINKNSSIDNKLKYYLNTYNDKLEHSRNKEVKIVAVKTIKFEL